MAGSGGSAEAAAQKRAEGHCAARGGFGGAGAEAGGVGRVGGVGGRWGFKHKLERRLIVFVDALVST